MRSVETRRRVYHLAPIGIAITSLTGSLQDVNDELMELLKSSGDDLLEENLGSFCRDDAAYGRLLADVLSAGKVLDRELEYRTKDNDLDAKAVFSAVLRRPAGRGLHWEFGTTNASPLGLGLEDQEVFLRLGYDYPPEVGYY